MAKLLPDLKHYHQPQSMNELMERMTEAPEDCLVLAGGTSLAFQRPKVSTVLDISRAVPSGSREDESRGVVTGAMTTISGLERDPSIRSYAGGILVEACRRLASTPLRNLITIGGNILGGYPWSDLPVALLAVDASVRVFDGSSTEKSLAMDFRHQSRKILDTNQLLTHVILPLRRKSHAGAFIKFSRTQVDFSLVSVAACFAVENGILSDVRIACGGLTPSAQRIPEAEQVLENSSGDTDTITEAAAAGAGAVQPRPEPRASVEYRKDLLKTLIFRAVRQAMGGVS